MATTIDLAGSQQSEGPPVTQVGILGWIRENLFSSITNTVLTLVSVLVIYLLTRSIVRFIPESDWTVLVTNWKLFLIGQYPRDQEWRTVASLIVVVFLALATRLAWRFEIGRRVLTVLWLLSPVVIWFLLAGIPEFTFQIHAFFPALTPAFYSPPIRWLLDGLIGLGIGIFLMQRRRSQGKGVRLRSLWLWFLLPIVGFIFLNFIVNIILPEKIFPLAYDINIPAAFPNILPEVRTQRWSGLLLTIMLAVVAIMLSFPIGVLLALGRRSDMIIVKSLSVAFIEAVRGVPLIAILFMSQVMLPLFINNRDLDVVLRAMGGFTLFSAAYVAETVRGGLQAIPRGQLEAAQAIGLNAVQVNGLIVLPQAIRIVIPSLVGQFISLFKDTTLVSIITLLDLLGISGAAIAQNPDFLFHKKEVYLLLAAVYFVFSFLMSSAARRIEARGSAMGGTRKL